MIPSDLHYDFPQAAYLIFILFLVLALFWSLFVYRKKALQLFSSHQNLKKLLIPRKYTFYKVIAFSLIWIAAIFSLMGPKGNGYYPNSLDKEPQNLSRLKAHDLIFMVDASASMAIDDTLSKKSRLDLAKEIADEVMSGLKGESAALYAFTSTATKISPQTLDLFFVRMMLRGISINEGGLAGTDFLSSLEKIKENHFKPSKTKLTTLIILSDGGDTQLETLQEKEQALRIQQILNLVDDPKKLNLRIFTIGLGKKTDTLVPDVQYQGKPVYSKLDSRLLKLLSEKGRGNYYEADQIAPLKIAKDLFQKMSQDDPYLKLEETNPNENLQYLQYYQIPLAIALLCLSFYLIFPNISKGIFISLFFCFLIPLNASPNESLKVAENYFEAKDYKLSQMIYKKMLDEKLGTYKKAVVQYNLATTYLYQNEFAKAVDLLESISLKGYPPPNLTRFIYTNLAIAKFNLSLKESEEDQTQLTKKVYLLKSSQDNLIKAKDAECELQKIKGRATCTLPSDLKELESLIDKALRDLSLKVNIDELYSSDATSINGQSLKTLLEKIKKIESEALTLKPTTLKELHALLEKAIEEETETLMMTRVLSRLKKPSKEALELVHLAQEKTILIADYYLKSLLLIQQQSYEMGKCQKKPWNEIIPLYNKGYEAATSALELISKNLEQASLKQEEAIKYWKEILKINEDHEKEAEKENAESNLEKTAKALELLQEMQMSDKPRKTQKQPTTQVIRPW